VVAVRAIQAVLPPTVGSAVVAQVEQAVDQQGAQVQLMAVMALQTQVVVLAVMVLEVQAVQAAQGLLSFVIQTHTLMPQA
jgi:hypothetical protein